MSSCAHVRRFFFRQRLRLVNHRPVYPVVERCVDCGHLVRAEVPPAEIQEAMLSVAMLDPDRWEGARG